ncbi:MULTISPECIES: hypothetical protein [unclassified Photorhabdus]|uniref:hypothetical protein n=1 Tax=unclassified Photorhabdus TaxID=2620880 RepID=UPI000DCD0992|nr:MULTISPECIES: hypothetical protein [unclassified Photorhabdus]RAW93947.1 hypothetical protein CKY03_21225 [Photorhabdus sp. S9-53]RAW94039.1 hypothetical protein CKY05_21145 [Photorhabdus sp. S10-54]RAW97505.1 hypothetical protein CKY04_21125 [Photorhabdus sp. S8-52]
MTTDNEKRVVQILIDTILIEEKLSELTKLVNSRFPNGFPDKFDSVLLGLSDDLIFIDRVTAINANGITHIIQRVDFGSRFNDFVAALRA